ncbi:MAG: ATP-binding cassette domain-containing protein [Sulfuricurvum sp.]|nr:ATP-binding cassette domain-containing protein [Sulfuricurvum sp.]
MSIPILSFENLDLSYELTHVLKNISLRIDSAEHCVILGANGSGKSSLIKLITSELYPSYKQEPFHREILGRERWAITELRQHIGVVTNDLHSRFAYERENLSGFETVLSGFFGTLGLFDHLEVKVEYLEGAVNAMKRLGIEHLRDKPLSQMSTGELRKCIVARALVHPVRAILLDEPTVGLDIKAQIDFIEMMRFLGAGGTTVILVTHHIEEIYEEISKVVLLKEGRIIAQGSKEAVLNSANLSETFGIDLELIRIGNRYRLIS